LIRTSYLVLFIILIAIGVGTASALVTITLAGDVVITGFLDMTGDKITNIGTPTLPADAATKGYVDSAPGTDTLALLGCTTDQVARWTGVEWTCSTINSTQGPISLDRQGLGSSIAIVNGKPTISYLGDSSLKYIQSINADGSSWNDPVIVDNSGPGRYTTLTIVNGKPAISYFESSNQDLKYVQASDVDGTSWNTPVTIDRIGNTGSEPFLSIVNGKPTISYQDITNIFLKYVTARDIDGINWSAGISYD